MIRSLARPLLASVFAVDGAQMLKNTTEHTAEAQAIVGNVRRLLPPNVASFIPKDEVSSVRLVAGTKIAGAALLGTSKAPRLGAAVLAAIQVPTAITRNAFWSEQDKDVKKTKQRGLITELALLGGLAITAEDTAGKPGLKWRVQKALPGKSEQEKMLENAQTQASDLFEKAKVGAAQAKESALQGKDALVAYVDDHSDEWKESAANFSEKAQAFASNQADNLSVQAAALSERAKEQSTELRKQAEVAQKNARKQAKKYRKQAKKQAKKYR
ncbi:DoxX family protein [Corynebacterium anserum]|uniref:DoxX family membrane protein n=1 Tax=Corynebacterium anserum TaxID=2684406 RepID=A0A7G7YN55_9CORY|nr:DoxX family protein [Corynebacterium anserum]MBC2680835.1 DoxX family membrane protein [Corynebacterium anserum]QNH95925.1 DoxX family membrane protein [Corynebacterium anserum]